MLMSVSQVNAQCLESIADNGRLLGPLISLTQGAFCIRGEGPLPGNCDARQGLGCAGEQDSRWASRMCRR
eukprot:COSAG01_NODE_10936_length_2045_cov_1.161871_2_plen_70_part_00